MFLSRPSPALYSSIHPEASCTIKAFSFGSDDSISHNIWSSQTDPVEHEAESGEWIQRPPGLAIWSYCCQPSPATGRSPGFPPSLPTDHWTELPDECNGPDSPSPFGDLSMGAYSKPPTLDGAPGSHLQMSAIILLTTLSNYPSDLKYSCPRLTAPGTAVYPTPNTFPISLFKYTPSW